MLSIAIAELGSFFAGVEVGAKTKFPIAVKYAGFDGLRHPAGFYESILFFIGAFIAYKIMFAVRREKFQKGFSVFFFWWYFAVIILLFSRLKVLPPSILKIDFNAAVSVAILLTSSLYFLYYFRSRFLKIRFPGSKKK